jgi:apolipoprotein N-acyltransferase
VDATTTRISDSLYGTVISGKANAGQLAQFSAAAAATRNDLLTRTRREAQAGAKLVFWAEGSASVLEADEAQFIARGRQLARAQGIYLGMAMGTVTPGAPKPLQNKMVLVTPQGEVAWQYYKSRLTPGPETASAVRGDGTLKFAQTPLGRLSAAICFDADFPRLLQQAGENGAGLVMVPASDWRAIDPWHAMMSSYRAIEDGVTVVRAAHQGLSGAWDAHGRLLAASDYYGTVDHTLVAEVPTQGVWTFYAHTGNWFAWLCLLSLAWLVGMARRASSRQHLPNSSGE